MPLSLLDSPFLPDTYCGEFVTDSSRNKEGETLFPNFQSVLSSASTLLWLPPPVSVASLHLYIYLLCLSPLRVPRGLSCLGQCHQKRLLSRWGDGHGLWPPHTLQCCSLMWLILPQAPWDGRHGMLQLHRLAWRNWEAQSVRGKQIRPLSLPTQLP